MRCPDCGWRNEDNRPNCIKCGTTLKSVSSEDKTDAQVSKPSGDGSQHFAGTTIGRKADLPAWDEKQAKSQEKQPHAQHGRSTSSKEMQEESGFRNDMLSCSDCGYPNVVRARFCVACGRSLSKSQEQPSVQDPIGKDNGENNSQNPVKISSGIPFASTVNPWSKSKQPQFSLSPLMRESERHQFMPLNFTGDAVELNRNNLESNNTTLTTKIQATIEYRDGEWYISNQSELQTTFIKVDGAIKLKKGDIILMGDRMFKFDY